MMLMLDGLCVFVFSDEITKYTEAGHYTKKGDLFLLHFLQSTSMALASASAPEVFHLCTAQCVAYSGGCLRKVTRQNTKSGDQSRASLALS